MRVAQSGRNGLQIGVVEVCYQLVELCHIFFGHITAEHFQHFFIFAVKLCGFGDHAHNLLHFIGVAVQQINGFLHIQSVHCGLDFFNIGENFFHAVNAVCHAAVAQRADRRNRQNSKHQVAECKAFGVRGDGIGVCIHRLV